MATFSIILNQNKEMVLALSYISREGYNKIKDELDYLTKVKRKEIAKDLDTARSHGDLKENAEYHAAKEAQAHNERRIMELSNQISTLSIMDDLDIPDDKVYLGATVHLKDVNSDEELKYMMVSDAEADYLEDKISVSSPIGKGLLGHEVDDEVEIQVPAGTLKYKILSISR